MARNVPGDARRTSGAAAADPVLINSAELARRLGISPSTLWDWRREKSPEGQRLRACIHRATASTTYWSVPKLRAAGLLMAAAPAVVAHDAATPGDPVLTVRWKVAL